MKFSSPANIALASIALSSPNLLSSPVFANAAPTGDPGSLSPNLGSGYFGTSPQMHAADSPVMPTAPSPSTSKIAGRRRSLRRSRSIKHRQSEKASRITDPLGLGVSAGDIQPEADSILRPRMAPAGSFSGTLGAIDPFSPVVGPGGLLANGLVPPNTPILGGVPLSSGIDPSTLVGAIPAMIPTPGVDNVIPIVQNTITGAPASLLSPLAGSLPVNGLSSSLGAVPVGQVPGALNSVVGNPPPLPGGISPPAGGLSTVQGVATQSTGTVPQLSGVLSHVPGVPPAQLGSLPIAVPGGLAPPAVLSSLGAAPNVAVPPIAGASSQVPGLLGNPQVLDPTSHIPDTIPQVPGILPKAPGSTSVVPQVPGAVPKLPAESPSKAIPDLPVPNLVGAAPVPVGSRLPLANPVAPATGSASPLDSLAIPATSVVPFSSVALPTPVSGHELPASLPNLDALPTPPVNHLPQPVQSLAPMDSLVAASKSVPRILVSGPDATGIFGPLEGVGAGATGRLEDGLQMASKHAEKESGILPLASGKFDGSGPLDEDKGAQIKPVIKSAVEPGNTSERPVDRTISELAPAHLATPVAKLDVPVTIEPLTSGPNPADVQPAISSEPAINAKEEILPVHKRWGSESPILLNDIGSPATDKIGSAALSEKVPASASSTSVPPAARLEVPSEDTIGVPKSASMETLKSFSMASIADGVAPISIPAEAASPVIGGSGSLLNMAQPTDLVPTLSDDSHSGHLSSDERPLVVPSVVASSPVKALYTGGAPLSRTLERSVDTPLSTVAISEDSPDMPSPATLGSGTTTNSQDTATRKIFRWGVPKMVKSTIRSVSVAMKK